MHFLTFLGVHVCFLESLWGSKTTKTTLPGWPTSLWIVQVGAIEPGEFAWIFQQMENFRLAWLVSRVKPMGHDLWDWRVPGTCEKYALLP